MIVLWTLNCGRIEPRRFQKSSQRSAREEGTWFDFLNIPWAASYGIVLKLNWIDSDDIALLIELWYWNWLIWNELLTWWDIELKTELWVYCIEPRRLQKPSQRSAREKDTWFDCFNMMNDFTSVWTVLSRGECHGCDLRLVRPFVGAVTQSPSEHSGNLQISQAGLVVKKGQDGGQWFVICFSF